MKIIFETTQTILGSDTLVSFVNSNGEVVLFGEREKLFFQEAIESKLLSILTAAFKLDANLEVEFVEFFQGDICTTKEYSLKEKEKEDV